MLKKDLKGACEAACEAHIDSMLERFFELRALIADTGCRLDETESTGLRDALYRELSQQRTALRALRRELCDLGYMP